MLHTYTAPQIANAAKLFSASVEGKAIYNSYTHSELPDEGACYAIAKAVKLIEPRAKIMYAGYLWRGYPEFIQAYARIGRVYIDGTGATTSYGAHKYVQAFIDFDLSGIYTRSVLRAETREDYLNTCWYENESLEHDVLAGIIRFLGVDV